MEVSPSGKKTHLRPQQEPKAEEGAAEAWVGLQGAPCPHFAAHSAAKPGGEEDRPLAAPLTGGSPSPAAPCAARCGL